MKPFFKEIVDLGHELYNGMPNLGANHIAFWPLETFDSTRELSAGRLACYHGTILPSEYSRWNDR